MKTFRKHLRKAIGKSKKRKQEYDSVFEKTRREFIKKISRKQ